MSLKFAGWFGEILALLVFSGLVLRWQKPNVLKCAVGLRHGMKPNICVSQGTLGYLHYGRTNLTDF